MLGLPLVGSHVAQVMIGVTDTLMLGWYDVRALAAVTIAQTLWFVLFIVGSGFAFAVLPMVASALGEGNERQVRRVTRMGLWLSAIYGLAVTVPLIWTEWIMLALGQTAETAAMAQDFLHIGAFGLVPALLTMVLKSYLSALERSQPILWITVIGALLNAGLNYLLIFGHLGFPEMGLRGAAIASVTLHVLGLFVFCFYSARVTPEHALFRRLWRIDREAFGQVLKLGWPIGLTNLAESGLFSAASVMVGWIGAIPLAAHGVALQLSSLTFVVHLGLSQAATVRVGNALGRKDYGGLREGAATASVLSAVFALVMMVVYLAIPEQMVGLFVAPDDPARPEILEVGSKFLIVAALFHLVDGAQVVALGLLRGLHDTRRPMVYAALSYWAVGIPVSYVMGFVLGWGGVGIWLGLVVGLTLAAALMLGRFWSQVGPRGTLLPT